VATLRLTVARILPGQGIGRFGLTPSQQQPLNLFIPLKTLQDRLEQEGRVNTLLASRSQTAPQELLDRTATLDDLGLQVNRKTSDRAKATVEPCATLESDRIFLQPAIEEAARRSAEQLSLNTEPLLTYLANTIRVGKQTIPYSVVTGADQVGPASVGPRADEIFLNEAAADDLLASVGSPVGLTYYLPSTRGDLIEKTTTFTLAAIVPMRAPWADPTLAPNFPGLAENAKMSNWDAPFKIDHSRIRPRDDAYWDDYRATPKAFVPLWRAREMWENPYGNLTAMRFWETRGGAVEAERLEALRHSLRREIPPASVGMAFAPVRAQGLAASQGASDFGQLFVGFSLFILVSVAALIQILFRLGIESRARQFGLLRAVGFTTRQANRLLLAEAALVAALGGALGLLLAVGYAVLMVRGLNTWWVVDRQSLCSICALARRSGGWVCGRLARGARRVVWSGSTSGHGARVPTAGRTHRTVGRPSTNRGKRAAGLWSDSGDSHFCCWRGVSGACPVAGVALLHHRRCPPHHRAAGICLQPECRRSPSARAPQSGAHRPGRRPPTTGSQSVDCCAGGHGHLPHCRRGRQPPDRAFPSDGQTIRNGWVRAPGRNRRASLPADSNPSGRTRVPGLGTPGGRLTQFAPATG
jgi:hypothetical protein